MPKWRSGAKIGSDVVGCLLGAIALAGFVVVRMLGRFIEFSLGLWGLIGIVVVLLVSGLVGRTLNKK